MLVLEYTSYEYFRDIGLKVGSFVEYLCGFKINLKWITPPPIMPYPSINIEVFSTPLHAPHYSEFWRLHIHPICNRGCWNWYKTLIKLRFAKIPAKNPPVARQNIKNMTRENKSTAENTLCFCRRLGPT